MIVFALLLSMASTTNAITSGGSCPENIGVVNPFNMSAYLGSWYEIYRYEYEDDLNMDCVTARYTNRSDGVVAIHNKGVVKDMTGTTDGTAELTDPTSTEAKLTVRFPAPAVTSPYWVLSTDYIGHAVVYSCTNLPNNQHVVFSWVLSRTPQIAGVDIAMVNTIVKDVKLQWKNFRPILHTKAACNGSPVATLSFAVSIIAAFFIKFL